MTDAMVAADALIDEPVDEGTRFEALRSSSIIGGSSVIVMLIRMVRTKLVAVLLGPGGVGLEAIFDSIVTLAKTLFDTGLGTSGVREIAAASGSAGEVAVARTAFTLRRCSVVLGALAAAVVFFAADPISRAAFGDTVHAGSIRLLSAVVFFGALAAAWGALLVGLRRIGDQARMSVWGTLAGAALTVPVLFIWRTDGIARYMVLAAAASFLVARFYGRRISLPAVSLTAREVFGEARGMIRLGLAFVATSMLATGSVFVLRVMVTRVEGIEAAGMFQAASALSMVYLGFILQAMGTDYFPRLTAAIEDGSRSRQIVNDQAEVSLLLALPGILGTLALSPLLIKVFYTGAFEVAADVLMWQMAGMFLRIVSWSVGYVLPAKGRSMAFIVTDVIAWSAYVGFAWWGLHTFGIVGVGIAFLAMYLFYSVLIYGVVRAVSGFRWSRSNLRLIALGVVTIAAVLSARLVLAPQWGLVVGLVVTLATGLFCLRSLLRIVGGDRMRRLVRRVLPWIPASREEDR